MVNNRQLSTVLACSLACVGLARQGTSTVTSKERVETYAAKISATARKQVEQELAARHLLARAFEKSRSTPCVAILYQKAIGGPSAAMQVKVEQSREGHTKVTVLQPLSLEGHVYVDNGKERRYYVPDKNQMMIFESPRLKMAGVDERLMLADQNYEFKIEGDVTIAGRKATCVAAVPKVKDMPLRRYYLDKENQFILRMEKVGRQGEERQLDTMHIRFVKDLPKENFEFRFIEKPTRIECPTPTSFSSSSAVKARLGFAPALPNRLPFGFVVEEPQISGEKENRFAAIRVTDGLVNGTVYQWTGRALPPLKGDKFAKGVWFRFVGDIPDGKKNELLDLFLREANKNTKMFSEPVVMPTTLKGMRSEQIALVMMYTQISAEADTGHSGMCAYSRNADLL